MESRRREPRQETVVGRLAIGSHDLPKVFAADLFDSRIARVEAQAAAIMATRRAFPVEEGSGLADALEREPRTVRGSRSSASAKPEPSSTGNARRVAMIAARSAIAPTLST